MDPNDMPAEGDKNKQPTSPVPGPPQGQKTATLPAEPAPVEISPESAPVDAAAVDAAEEVPAELHEYRDVAEGVQARVRTPEERAESAQQMAAETSAQN